MNTLQTELERTGLIQDTTLDADTIPVPPTAKGKKPKRVRVPRAHQGPLNPTEVSDRVHSDQNLIANFQDSNLIAGIKAMVQRWIESYKVDQPVLGKFVASYDAANPEVKIAILESFKCEFDLHDVDGKPVKVLCPPIGADKEHGRTSLAAVLFFGHADLLAGASDSLACKRLTNWVTAYRNTEKIAEKTASEEKREERKSQGIADAHSIVKALKDAETPKDAPKDTPKAGAPKSCLKLFTAQMLFTRTATSNEKMLELQEFLIRSMIDAGFDPKKVTDTTDGIKY